MFHIPLSYDSLRDLWNECMYVCIDCLPVSQQQPPYYPMPVKSCPHSYTIILLQIDYNDTSSTSRSVTLECTFSSSFKLQFVLLCHFPPFKLPTYSRNNNRHQLTWQYSGARNRSCNLTKIISSLNKIKIRCCYNSNICTCQTQGRQPNNIKSTVIFQFMCSFSIKTGKFWTRRARTLFHWEIIYLFFELKEQHIFCQDDHNTAVHRCAPCNMVGGN